MYKLTDWLDSIARAKEEYNSAKKQLDTISRKVPTLRLRPNDGEEGIAAVEHLVAEVVLGVEGTCTPLEERVRAAMVRVARQYFMPYQMDALIEWWLGVRGVNVHTCRAVEEALQDIRDSEKPVLGEQNA